MRTLSDEKKMYMVGGIMIGMYLLIPFGITPIVECDKIYISEILMGFFLSAMFLVSSYTFLADFRKLSYKNEEGQKIYYHFFKRKYYKSITRIVFFGSLWYIFGENMFGIFLGNGEPYIVTWFVVGINLGAAILFAREIRKSPPEIAAMCQFYEEPICTREFILVREYFFFGTLTIFLFVFALRYEDRYFALASILAGGIQGYYLKKIMKTGLCIKELTQI